MIIQLIDVNDETPTFEKALYEFILTTDLKNFTIPAFIKANDADAEAPNNIVRYEIIHGNYENKFMLNEITGQLMLREPLIKRSKRQTNAKADMDVFVLTARAFDLGVPVRFSTTTVRIYPPESRTRAVSFLVPGYSPDRQKLEDSLSDLTGGRVVIQEVKPYTGNLNGVINPGSRREEKSMVTATVIYDSDTVVDVAEIQKRLMQSNNQAIVVHEDAVRIIETPPHSNTTRMITKCNYFSTERLQSRESGSFLVAHLPSTPSRYRNLNTSAVLHMFMVPTLCCLKVIIAKHKQS